MATLDHWLRFLEVPKTLRLREASLMGRDHESVVVTGSADVTMPSFDDFIFELRGTPSDLRHMFAKLKEIRDRPYDGLARLRLVGTDEAGVEWAGGYTIPHVEDGENTWRFSGRLDSLSMLDVSETASSDSSTELKFKFSDHEPICQALLRALPAPREPGATRTFDVSVLDTVVRFEYEPRVRVLTLTAAHSHALPPTYTENWLSEPLRIMFGQLIYPRLVARNLGKRSFVWVRRSPPPIRQARWAALLDIDDPDEQDFWTTYRRLLTIVAWEKEFEPLKLTQMYEEIIMASPASRWVWALTFASGIEGLAKMLAPGGSRPDDAEQGEIAQLTEHIARADSAPWLKNTAINALKRNAQPSATNTLRSLIPAGVITQEQLRAWQAIRHPVMHGDLVSRYSSEKEDAQIMAVSKMFHRLAREVLRRIDDPPELH